MQSYDWALACSSSTLKSILLSSCSVDDTSPIIYEFKAGMGSEFSGSGRALGFGLGSGSAKFGSEPIGLSEIWF